jgi:hypothetical protein
MQQMIIANRLGDGFVVFLAPNHEWVTSIGDGAVFAGGAPAEQAMEAARRHEVDCLIVEPALIEVTVRDGQVRPTAIREAIRAFGPTIRTDLAEGEDAAVEAWR